MDTHWLLTSSSSNKPSLNSLKWLVPLVQSLIWCINLSCRFQVFSMTLLFPWFLSYPQQLITLFPSICSLFGLILEFTMTIFYFHFEIKLAAISMENSHWNTQESVYSRADWNTCLNCGMQSIYLCTNGSMLELYTNWDIRSIFNSFVGKFKKGRRINLGASLVKVCNVLAMNIYLNCCLWN